MSAQHLFASLSNVQKSYQWWHHMQLLLPLPYHSWVTHNWSTALFCYMLSSKSAYCKCAYVRLSVFSWNVWLHTKPHRCVVTLGSYVFGDHAVLHVEERSLWGHLWHWGSFNTLTTCRLKWCNIHSSSMHIECSKLSLKHLTPALFGCTQCARQFLLLCMASL